MTTTEQTPDFAAGDLAFARSIVKSLRRGLGANVDEGDLVGPALEAVVDARRRFDASRGVTFGTFARHRVRGAVLDELRRHAFVPRSVRGRARRLEAARAAVAERTNRAPTDRELAEHLDVPVAQLDRFRQSAQVYTVVSLDQPIEGSNDRLGDLLAAPEALVDARLCDAELKASLQLAIQALPERERTALVLFYFRQVPLKDVGAVLGVSESRACQLCGQAISRLRARLRAA